MTRKTIGINHATIAFNANFVLSVQGGQIGCDDAEIIRRVMHEKEVQSVIFDNCFPHNNHSAEILKNAFATNLKAIQVKNLSLHNPNHQNMLQCLFVQTDKTLKIGELHFEPLSLDHNTALSANTWAQNVQVDTLTLSLNIGIFYGLDVLHTLMDSIHFDSPNESLDAYECSKDITKILPTVFGGEAKKPRQLQVYFVDDMFVDFSHIADWVELKEVKLYDSGPCLNMKSMQQVNAKNLGYDCWLIW